VKQLYHLDFTGSTRFFIFFDGESRWITDLILHHSHRYISKGRRADCGLAPVYRRIDRRELARKVYRFTKKPGFAKDYNGLKIQIQNAAGSSMHNIADYFDSETKYEEIKATNGEPEQLRLHYIFVIQISLLGQLSSH
jgi:hypothetical protein